MCVVYLCTRYRERDKYVRILFVYICTRFRVRDSVFRKCELLLNTQCVCVCVCVCVLFNIVYLPQLSLPPASPSPSPPPSLHRLLQVKWHYPSGAIPYTTEWFVGSADEVSKKLSTKMLERQFPPLSPPRRHLILQSALPHSPRPRAHTRK